MKLIQIAAGNYRSEDGVWRVFRFERKASSDWVIYRDDAEGREILESFQPTLRDCRKFLEETVTETLTADGAQV